jgi:hypothetical protein
VTVKPQIPLWRWLVWWTILFVGIVAFYVVMTPIWLAVRGAAWIAEQRRHRHPLSAR